MPKETIHATNPTMSPSPRHVVEVGWQKWDGNLGSVQIAALDPTTHKTHGTNEESEAGLLALSVGMNRADVNRLIRVLRKARDETFGTDA